MAKKKKPRGKWTLTHKPVGSAPGKGETWNNRGFSNLQPDGVTPPRPPKRTHIQKVLFRTVLSKFNLKFWYLKFLGENMPKIKLFDSSFFFFFFKYIFWGVPWWSSDKI